MKIARVLFDGRTYEGVVSKLGFQPYIGSFYDGTARPEGGLLPLDEIRFLTPCHPRNIVAVGKNYLDHAKEFGGDIPDRPILFLKPATAAVSHLAHIEMPEGFGRIDYEGELAFVVKKTAKKVASKDAADYILGYTCMFDMTAREVQRADGQWTRGKSFDTFAPFGPTIETDADIANAVLTTRKNGVTVQHAPCSDMRWQPHDLLSFITAFMTLYPGDVVTTGTPAGIGPVESGDTLELEITSVGTLINKVI